MKINAYFMEYVDALPALLDQLLACPAFNYDSSPPFPEVGGVYLFTEDGEHMYVGRTGNLRQRAGQHCRVSSGHNSAPFTFLLTREALGLPAANYRPGAGRDALMADSAFAAEFRNQNIRVNRMLIRYVQEEDPYVQTLFEVYCAVVLRTRYNDFNNH